MDFTEMSQINAMKERVRSATQENCLEMGQAIPVLIESAHKAKRETKLEMLEIARSIIDKIEELEPNIVKEPIWLPYAALRPDLNDLIMETRFAR